MATIARDISTPFDPTDPLELQEFEEFMCPPDTADMVADLQNPLAVDSRAHRLLDVNSGIVGRIVENDVLPTPDPVVPDVVIDRRGMNRDTGFPIPGAGTTEMWSFRDDDSTFVWPGPAIRIREGRSAHTIMSSSRGQHTIHHHGIEPTSMNDGVGHITFDVNGEYAYQWLAKEAGTYFYHCHVNTVLHFEMGMYGMLIIDPDVAGAPFTTGGPGSTHVGNTLTPYDAEAIWVTDDIDRRWHANAEHGTGSPETGVLCGGQFIGINHPDNPRLHLFEPDVFVISGHPPPNRALTGPLGRHPIPNANVSVAPGGRVLLRILNGAYTTTRYRFPPALQGLVIAADGRTLGRAPFGNYSSPFTLASVGHQFRLTTAQRWDILIENAPPGEHIVEMDFHHWITDEIFDFGRLSASIMVGVG